MRKRTGAPSAYRKRVPPDGDLVWHDLAAPLLELLAEGPRTPEQLDAWRRPLRITANWLMQMIAWGENRRLVYWQQGSWRLASSRDARRRALAVLS
jgi:hypothetical protein